MGPIERPTRQCTDTADSSHLTGCIQGGAPSEPATRETRAGAGGVVYAALTSRGQTHKHIVIKKVTL